MLWILYRNKYHFIGIFRKSRIDDMETLKLSPVLEPLLEYFGLF